MTPLMIIELVSRVGLPLAQQLIALYHQGNAPVNAEQWAELSKLAAYRSVDSLKAAGLKVENGKVVPA